MAIIGKIRNYSGLLIVIVGVALAAFILGDFYRKGTSKHGITDVGEIGGEKISRNDFERKVDELADQIKEQQKEQTGEEKISPAQMFQVRQEVWDKMLKDIIMSKEFDELGIVVTPDELNDWVRGNNPHRLMRQYFSNPQTGQFEKARVDQILQNLDQLDPKLKKQWLSLEDAIKEDVINTKYTNLVSKGIYFPKAIAKFDFEARSRKAHIRFISVKYNSIPDTDVKITDDDIKKYYDEHKYEYQQDEPSRDLEYVVYDVLPSAKDRKDAEKEITQVKEDLAKTDDFTNFFNQVNSDTKYDSLFHKKGTLPLRYDTTVFNLSPGTIIGPIVENNKYYLAKLIAKEERPDSMKASHILIAYSGSRGGNNQITKTKEQAKKLADSLAIVLKKDTTKFKEFAAKFSNDPSAQKNGGDLGWFSDGAMVYQFNNACLKNKVGDVVVTETMFGYHVILVKGKTKLSEKVKLAMIELPIRPSNETNDSIIRIASKFAGENNTEKSFNDAIIKNGLNKRVAQNVRAMDSNIPGLESPRDIIRWAYDENSKKGDIKYFEIVGEPNKYVIALLKEIHEKGTAPLEIVKKDIENKVRLEKKAETIIEKINKEGNKDLYNLASKFKEKVDTVDFLTFSSYALPTAGPEPEVIGKIFSMKPKMLSEPIEGKTGIFVIMLDDFAEPPVSNNNYKENIMQMDRFFSSRVSYEIFNDLKKNTEVEDNRIKFY